MKSISKLKIPKLGLSVTNAMPETIKGPIKTDDFTFGEAFKYYRQCLGTDSSFIWKGQTYSTLLIEEIIIELADSAEVQTKSTKINEVSELH